jgi:hypothetical protein
VAGQCKGWVCGSSHPGIACSNPANVLDVCRECCMLCLRRADHLSRGVLPIVVCLSVCDLETSTMKRPGPKVVCCVTGKKRKEKVGGGCASVGGTVTTFFQKNIIFI